MLTRALVLLGLVGALAGCGATLGLDVPFRGTPPTVVDAMLRLAEVTRTDVVYDLGSGDGRIPIAAARDFGARGVGFDIDPHLVNVSRENAKRAGVAERGRFEVQDIFTASFADATVVALYLSPEFNLRLRPWLRRELKPGSRIVSQYHDMADWPPVRQVDVPVDGVVRPVYLWVVGR